MLGRKRSAHRRRLTLATQKPLAVGRAALYDLRYATQPITDDTDEPWATAFKLKTPVPAAAGSAETLTVVGLPGGTLYFALQANDDMRRLSPLSNVVTVRIPYLVHAPNIMR